MTINKAAGALNTKMWNAYTKILQWYAENTQKFSVECYYDYDEKPAHFYAFEVTVNCLTWADIKELVSITDSVQLEFKITDNTLRFSIPSKVREQIINS